MEVLSSSASVWFLKFLFPLLGGSFWRRFWMDESDSGESLGSCQLSCTGGLMNVTIRAADVKVSPFTGLFCTEK